MALLGGTFDPVHNGHLIMARAVCESCRLGRMTFVPALSPPHKEAAEAAAEHRLAMLRAAVRGDPMFDISQVELDRSGPSYTLETLKAMRRQFGPETTLHLVIGADMVEGLPDWHRAREVVEMARIIVALRPPWQERIDEILDRLTETFGDRVGDSIRQGVVRTPLLEISSSDIRGRVRRGLPIRYLTPDSVVSYIEQEKLYR